MKCGQIFGSVEAWRKLSAVPLKAKVGYQILQYTKLVSAEHQLVEEQRVALIYRITLTKPGTEVKIEPNTNEFAKYIEGFNEILAVESNLKPFGLMFEDVLEAITGDDGALSVSDLSVLEPFFASSDSKQINLLDDFDPNDETVKKVCERISA